MWLQAHVGFWQLALVVFVISYILLIAGKLKAQKILHMILRLLYVCVFITGLYLVFHVFSTYGIWVIIKMICGLVVLSMMEMVLVRRLKKKSTGLFWGLLIVFLIFVLYIGYGKLG